MGDTMSRYTEEELPPFPFQVAYREDLDWGLIVLVDKVSSSIYFNGTVIVTPNEEDWKIGYVGTAWPRDKEKAMIL